jgi:hypothetical protein
LAFVAVAAVFSEAAAVLLVVGLILVLPGLAYLDAVNVPGDSWNAAGRSRSGWTISFFIVPLGISMVATVAYWTWLRRRLPGGALEAGESVEITTGLHAGQRATLTKRFMFGLGGLWKATVAEGDGSTVEVQVSSSTVRRCADAAHEPAAAGTVPSSPQAGPAGSIKFRLAALGLFVVVCGGAVVAIGTGVEGGLGAIVVVLGAAAIGLGLFQTAFVSVRFSSRNRLPERLRGSLPASGEPVSLELGDGRRITATGVLPGGYVLPRRTDPPFHAADAKAVVPASPEEIDEERRRQARPT